MVEKNKRDWIGKINERDLTQNYIKKFYKAM